MRFIVFGVGAVGGTIAGKLARAGLAVAGIARGEQLVTLQRDGLRVETPEGDEHSRFAMYEGPEAIRFATDDVILLCMKSQDTPRALEQLRAAGVREQPIVCVQNGVANETIALRMFANVYGICVMLPSSYLQPGVVRAYSLPAPGILDVGRFPAGGDPAAAGIASALERAGFSSRPDADIMRAKYGKLLMNLGNAIGAALGPWARNSRFATAARNEGEAALEAAGISWANVDFDSERRGDLMNTLPVHGEGHPGSSSWQSLQRGAGSIETDYLNGEIVLLGRLHGIPTPVNAYFCQLAHHMLRSGTAPGTVPVEQVEHACPAA